MNYFGPGNVATQLASQPSWSFEHAISNVGQTDDGTVYLAEGDETGYLPTAARRAIGW